MRKIMSLCVVLTGSIGILGLGAAAAGSTEPTETTVSFKDQCTEAMSGGGRPAFIIKGVCRCIEKKTTEKPALRSELLGLAKLPSDEQEEKMSPELKEIRDSCRPF